MNSRHIEIMRIYKLSKETKIGVDKIAILFPKYTCEDIYKIRQGLIYNHITSSVQLDTDYINQITRTEHKNIFPLGSTYVIEIYKFAKSESISMNLLSNIFGISYETVKRIKNGDVKRYIKYTKDVVIEKADKKRCKMMVELTEEQKHEVIKMNTSISKGDITLRKVSQDYNVDLSTIKHVYRDYGVELDSKFKPNKLSDEDAIDIFRYSNSGEYTRSELAKRYGVSTRTIGAIKNGQSHIDVLRYNGLIP